MAADRETAPSRTERKRAARAVEDLARRLVALPASAIEKIPIDADLRRELQLARATRGHGARDRQIRHLAALLRGHPEQWAPLGDYVGRLDGRQRQEQDAFHQLEEWRDRLCHPAEFAGALQEISASLPGLDIGRIGRLAGAVHAGNDRKAAREIFRLLRAAREKAAQPE